MNNFDFDFDLDFDLDIEEPRFLDINAVIKCNEKKERVLIDFEQGTKQLRAVLADFDPRKEYRFISNGKGFSSINFIDFVAKNFGEITRLYASTLGVGKKHIEYLATLPIRYAFFVFSGIFKDSKIIKEYGYFSRFIEICKNKNWDYCSAKNHSKIILMQTKSGKYFVLESSANLNENPKIEQFTFQEDKNLFDWYLEFFEAIKHYALGDMLQVDDDKGDDEE